MRILVLNGPNLNLLGTREPDLYGTQTLESISEMLEKEAAALDAELDLRQSNSEGELVGWIQEARGRFDGILINPGGLSHTSVSILDALLAVALPAVEVHVTSLVRRESFRRESLTARGAEGRVEGFGPDGYRLGLLGLVRLIRRR